MSLMTFDRISAVIQIVVGVYSYLLFTGRIKVKEPQKLEVAKQKFGTFVKLGAPVLVIFGIWTLLTPIEKHEVKNDATLPLDHQWEVASLPKSGMSVLLPGTPKFDQQEMETPAGKTVSHMVSWAPENKYPAFFAFYFDSPTGESFNEKIFDTTRDSALSKADGKASVINEQPIKHGNLTGRALEMQAGPYHLNIRKFISGKRFIMLQVSSLQPEAIVADTKKFFDSFKLEEAAVQ